MLFDVMIAAFLGAVLCLDRLFVQAMISRPIVAAPAVAWLLNEPSAGLMAGALLELFWLDRTAIGAYVPPNESLAAILVAGSAAILSHQFAGHSREIFVLCFLFFLPFGVWGGKMDAVICQWNNGLSDRALEDAARGDMTAVSRRHLTAALRSFFSDGVFLFAGMAAGCYLLRGFVPLMSPWMTQTLGLAYILLPLIALAAALNALSNPRAIHIFCVAYLVAILIVEWARV
ncbi:MAG TPA: PTS sugar transporter subunit IIC [Syntrophales bacterium]|nr:PTS sugar transporter subunit IIC [Syntrophales bacterium]